MNLRRLDLNLLTVFEAVYEEKSQQKASERLYMSQPAISNAISRLRNVLDDRLFVGNKTIQTTHKADELYLQVSEALNLIRAGMQDSGGFNPETTVRTFSIAISYSSGFILGAPIFRRFQSLAPRARLVVRTIDPHDEIPRMLRDQTIDLAITQRSVFDQMIESELCLDFELVVVVREGHPRIQSHPTLEAIEAEDYLSVHDSSYDSRSADLQDLLRRVESKAKMEVPNALMLPVILSQTDLVAFIPRVHAEIMRNSYPLQLFDLPLPQVVNHATLIWHRSFNKDPGHAWFRGCCLDVFKSIRQEIGSPESAGASS